MSVTLATNRPRFTQPTIVRGVRQERRPGEVSASHAWWTYSAQFLYASSSVEGSWEFFQAVTRLVVFRGHYRQSVSRFRDLG